MGYNVPDNIIQKEASEKMEQNKNNGKGLLVIVNFTNEKLMFQKIDQKCELCNYHETESEWLQPYEARIYSK